jgi:glutamate--cysteine ligase
MGDIGYHYRKDAEVPVRASYNDMQSYLRDLYRLITTPHPQYTQMGVKDSSGQYQQLNTNVLQIENEFYSTVRPKQIPEPRELPLLAMLRRGIRYIELRSLDVDVFSPAGMSQQQLDFVEVMMLYCLFVDSPPLSFDDIERIAQNLAEVAHRGREPGKQLARESGYAPLQAWGMELLDSMLGVAGLLDRDAATTRYTSALVAQRDKFIDAEATPSARVVREMHDEFESFYEFSRTWSSRHAATFADPADENMRSLLQREASLSIERQAEMEAADSGDFDQYLSDYFSQLQHPDLLQFAPDTASAGAV